MASWKFVLCWAAVKVLLLTTTLAKTPCMKCGHHGGATFPNCLWSQESSTTCADDQVCVFRYTSRPNSTDIDIAVSCENNGCKDGQQNITRGICPLGGHLDYTDHCVKCVDNQEKLDRNLEVFLNFSMDSNKVFCPGTCDPSNLKNCLFSGKWCNKPRDFCRLGFRDGQVLGVCENRDNLDGCHISLQVANCPGTVHETDRANPSYCTWACCTDNKCVADMFHHHTTILTATPMGTRITMQNPTTIKTSLTSPIPISTTPPTTKTLTATSKPRRSLRASLASQITICPGYCQAGDVISCIRQRKKCLPGEMCSIKYKLGQIMGDCLPEGMSEESTLAKDSKLCNISIAEAATLQSKNVDTCMWGCCTDDNCVSDILFGRLASFHTTTSATTSAVDTVSLSQSPTHFTTTVKTTTQSPSATSHATKKTSDSVQTTQWTTPSTFSHTSQNSQIGSNTTALTPPLTLNVTSLKAVCQESNLDPPSCSSYQKSSSECKDDTILALCPVTCGVCDAIDKFDCHDTVLNNGCQNMAKGPTSICRMDQGLALFTCPVSCGLCGLVFKKWLP